MGATGSLKSHSVSRPWGAPCNSQLLASHASIPGFAGVRRQGAQTHSFSAAAGVHAGDARHDGNQTYGTIAARPIGIVAAQTHVAVIDENAQIQRCEYGVIGQRLAYLQRQGAVAILFGGLLPGVVARPFGLDMAIGRGGNGAAAAGGAQHRRHDAGERYLRSDLYILPNRIGSDTMLGFTMIVPGVHRRQLNVATGQV